MTANEHPAIPLGLRIFDAPPQNAEQFVAYADYIREIFAQAGLCYRDLANDRWAQTLTELHLLVTVGEADLDEADRKAIEEFVGRGGTWISVAGVCGLEHLLGIDPVKPRVISRWGTGTRSSLGECYLSPTAADHPTMRGVSMPLHGFGGLAARAAGATVLATILDKHHRPTDRVAVSVRQVEPNGDGNGAGVPGRAIFFAVDLPGTVVRIQQGVGATRDGVSAPDGSGPITDRTLKSDDGAVLDWILDRVDVPGLAGDNDTGMSAYLCPMADQWRQVFLRVIFDAALHQGVSLPVLWIWPNRLPAVAHLSFDTDGNDPELGRTLFELCRELDVQGTWCVIMPGYERSFIRELAADGQELAMHYDAMTPGRPWSHEQFLEQHAGLTELFDGHRPLSNKNHYLRWEGDVEFYHWLEEVGIELDQSKGSSKTGELGFNFGTCHPFWPVDEKGAKLNVLEIATTTQDVGVFAPKPAAVALLEAAIAEHGVFHLLFHPAHIAKPGEREGFTEMVNMARSRGLTYWTAAKINEWQRARREITWQADSAGRLNLTAKKPLTQATLLWLNVGSSDDATNITMNDKKLAVAPLRCWGFDFHSVVVDLPAGTHPFENKAARPANATT